VILTKERTYYLAYCITARGSDLTVGSAGRISSCNNQDDGILQIHDSDYSPYAEDNTPKTTITKMARTVISSVGIKSNYINKQWMQKEDASGTGRSLE
jgi:hypothetical protein